MGLDNDIEIMALMGSYSRIENANYALIVNHKSKTYVRVDIMNKSVIAILNVFNIPRDIQDTIQKFRDVSEFKKKYPKYK